MSASEPPLPPPGWHPPGVVVGPAGPVTGPGSAGVGPTGWPQAPPPQTARLAWLWISLGILGVLGVTAVVGIALLVNAVRDPVDGMNEFLRAVDREDYDAAYEMLCATERDGVSRESFSDVISTFADDLDEWNVYTFDPSGDRRVVQFDVTDFDGDHTTYEATMVKERGEWRVCDFFEEPDIGNDVSD